MTLAWFFVPAVTAALLALAVTPLVRRLAFAVGAVDHPGFRKIHRAPTARLGGLAIIFASTAAFSILMTVLPNRPSSVARELAFGLGLGILPILAVSIRDDIRPVAAWTKFAAHALGAGIAVACGVALNPTVHMFGHSIDIGLLAIPLSVLWLMGLTNAFNIVDGLDGLAAGLALISSGSLAAVFLAARLPGMSAASLVVAGAIIGFLPYNLHPARIFLGDTGATAIGFTLACFALRGGTTLSAGFATLLPVFVVAVPLAETLVSMTRRFVRRASTGTGNGIMEADRNHIHHRLLDMGVDHRRAVLILYAVGLGLASCALVSILMTVVEAGLLLMALLLAALVGISRLGYDEFAFIRNGVVLRFYETPMLRRSLFAVFADLVLVSLAVYAAVVLKFEDFALVQNHDMAMRMVAVLAPITVACFWTLGLYRGSWRVTGARDFLRSCLAVTVSAFLGFLVYQLLWAHTGSLAVFAIYGLVKLMFANGGRLSYKLLLDTRWRAENRGKPVMIYGAGMGGAAALRELLSNNAMGMRPVAFIDDDPMLVGKSVDGYRIAGGVDDLQAAIERLKPHALIVASEKIPPIRVAKARAVCHRMSVRVLRMSIRFDGYDVEAQRVMGPRTRLLTAVADGEAAGA